MSKNSEFDDPAVRDGLVVRNTFLDYPELQHSGEDGEAPGRRPRAKSDLTDTKLPWKVPVSDQADTLYQITRRRLGSNTDELTSPVGAEPGLGTVEEEEEITSRTHASRSSRAVISNYGGIEPPLDPRDCGQGSIPTAGFFPHGATPFGPAIPMFPGYAPGPWNFPPSLSWMSAVQQHPGMFNLAGLIPPHAHGLPQQSELSEKVTPSQHQYRDEAALLPQREKAGGGNSSASDRKANKNERGSKKGGGAGGGGGDRHGGGNASGGGGGGSIAKAKAKAHAEGSEPKVRGAPNSPPPQPPGEPTTVMLRNIPNRYTSGSLLVLLDERGFQACYDFVYLPMDFQNGVNLGYAFVNLLRHSDAIRFKDVFQGFQDWRFDSAKVSEVSWAHPHQGLTEHVERYRNSPVMHPSMPDEYKPMMFSSGKRVQFPPPTRVIKAPKLRLGRDRPRDGTGKEEPASEGA
mmetsp:Transcript_90903/g.261985  ORF Transcript_90903/g.261985 Transcript_90903/m.261985 type:complete len:460 (-) Transcript_90903:87-1466(-)